MNRPPIKKTCPECGGSGIIPMEKRDWAFHDECKKCIDGEVYNYKTPEQWEAETGKKMLDSDPVWVSKRNRYSTEWGLYTYEECKYFRGLHHEIVARPGQPKPPEDYRP